MLPPRLGSLADSFLTPRRRPQPHIDPGAPACMAWPGPGQGPPGDTGTAGGGGGGYSAQAGGGAREPGPRTEAAPADNLWALTHPAFLFAVLLMSLAKH